MAHQFAILKRGVPIETVRSCSERNDARTLKISSSTSCFVISSLKRKEGKSKIYTGVTAKNYFEQYLSKLRNSRSKTIQGMKNSSSSSALRWCYPAANFKSKMPTTIISFRKNSSERSETQKCGDMSWLSTRRTKVAGTDIKLCSSSTCEFAMAQT